MTGNGGDCYPSRVRENKKGWCHCSGNPTEGRDVRGDQKKGKSRKKKKSGEEAATGQGPRKKELFRIKCGGGVKRGCARKSHEKKGRRAAAPEIPEVPILLQSSSGEGK